MGLGINLIEDERNRQIHVEGWTEEHDDKHVNNELALAAACYAVPDMFSQGYWPPTWDLSWYKSTTRIRDLVKEGALNCTLFEVKYDYTENDYLNLKNNIYDIINT